MNAISKRAPALTSNWADEPGDERKQAQSFARDLFHA